MTAQVAAVLTNGAEGTAVASRAAEVAGEGGCVLALIPLARPGFTTDAAIAQRMDARLGAKADAIFARVRSIFRNAGVAVEVRIVRHAPGGALRAALRRAARAGIDEAIVPVSLLPSGEPDEAITVDTRMSEGAVV